MSATRLFLFTTFSLRTPNHKPLSLIPPRVLAQRFNFSSLRFRRYSSSVAVDAVTGCDTDSAKLSERAPDPLLPRPASNPVQQKKQVKFAEDELLQDVEMKRGDWMCPKCNFLNFARNVICLKCKEDGSKSVRGGDDGMKKGDWICCECNFVNFSRNMRCLKCGAGGPKRLAVDEIEVRKGDWNCPQCNFMNFSRNTRCLKCGAGGPKRLAVDEVEVRKGDWNCPQCDYLNYSKNNVCPKCKSGRPKEDATEYQEQVWWRPY